MWAWDMLSVVNYDQNVSTYLEYKLENHFTVTAETCYTVEFKFSCKSHNIFQKCNNSKWKNCKLRLTVIIPME